MTISWAMRSAGTHRVSGPAKIVQAHLDLAPVITVYDANTVGYGNSMLHSQAAYG